MNPGIFRINDHVVGFYLGRGIGGQSPYHHVEGNWVDLGSWALGGINYVVHRGDEAIVYDTSTLPEAGRWEREWLERELGISRFTVVLSHWHLDHIAGNGAFADCEIVAPELTAKAMAEQREEIEAGTLWGPPGFEVVMPTSTFSGELDLRVGDVEVQFRQFEIHSADQNVMVLPGDRALYPGDALEETVSYVIEPERIPTHIEELDRLRRLDVARIFPNHGNPEVIASGGYSKALIDAVEEYDRNLLARVDDDDYLEQPIETFVPRALASGTISIWEPYRAVHAQSLGFVREAWGGKPLPAGLGKPS